MKKIKIILIVIMMRNIYNRIVNKMKESQNSSSKNKKIMNKTKNQNK